MLVPGEKQVPADDSKRGRAIASIAAARASSLCREWFDWRSSVPGGGHWGSAGNHVREA